MPSTLAERRDRACLKLLAEVHTVIGAEGPTPSALHAAKLKLVALARKAELFPLADFPAPDAQGRTHPVLVEEGADAYGLYVTVNLPGKEAAPHDHGVWCINAAVSGREQHVFYRRTDQGSAPGRATIQRLGEVTVERGVGMAMADHDIHSTLVIGTEPAVGLALYGYPLSQFPSVVRYHTGFGTMRASPSKRAVVPA